MNLYWSLVLVFLVRDCISEKQLWNMIKGRHQTSKLVAVRSKTKHDSFVICETELVQFKAKFYYKGLGDRNIKMNIAAMVTNRDSPFAYYELEKYYVDPDEDMGKRKEYLKNSGICDSFKVEKKDIMKKPFLIIKFYNNGEWWCDVYARYTFKYKEMDKCSVLDTEYEALNDKDYHSVYFNDPLKKLNFIPCPENERPTHVVCKTDKFQVKAKYYCKNDQVGYKLFTFYDGYELDFHVLPNYKSISGKVDAVKACRLFRFKADRQDNSVDIQFLSQGMWWCRRYVVKSTQVNTYYEVDWRGLVRDCKRFRSYRRPH